MEQEEGLPFGRELVIQGALERMVPILMTAALALAPATAWRGHGQATAFAEWFSN
jgi:Cu/Ag efflux pump CusA